MKTRRIILLVSLVVGVLSMIGLRGYVEQRGQLQAESINYLEAAIAAVTIPENTVITEEMLALMSFPEGYVMSDGFTSTDQLVGSVARASIYQGEQILNNRVLLDVSGEEAKLSYQIPDDKRAISIPISERSAVSGHVKKGDYVDLLMTMPLKDHVASISEFTKVKVLWVGQANRAVDDTAMPSTMVLLVTPKQSKDLVIAMSEGTVTVALRSSFENDPETHKLSGRG